MDLIINNIFHKNINVFHKFNYKKCTQNRTRNSIKLTLWGSDGDVLEADVDVGGCCNEGGGGVVDDVDILGEAAAVGAEYWFSILKSKQYEILQIHIWTSFNFKNGRYHSRSINFYDQNSAQNRSS